MRRSKGFTLIELLVVIAIIALLVSILVPTLGRARELARQAGCMANVSAMGKAVALYSGTYDDKYPFPLFFTGGNPNTLTGLPTTQFLVGTTTTTTLNYANLATSLGSCTNAMQNLWILVKENTISANAFKCPSDTSSDQPGAGYFFTANTQYSYGIQWPYDGAAAGGTDNPYSLDNQNLSGATVIFADRAPGTGSTAAVVNGNISPAVTPSNHKDTGEILGRRDTSVKKYASINDSKAGYGGDEIYAGGDNGGTVAGTPGGEPVLTTTGGPDTSIVPNPSR